MMCEGALAERRRAWFLSDMLAALLAAETGLIVALQMILNCVQWLHAASENRIRLQQLTGVTDELVWV